MGKAVMSLILRLMDLLTLALALSSNSALEDDRVTSWGKFCERVPPGMHAPKTPGSNGFVIKISGNPDHYVPGERYTISLLGYRSPNVIPKFTAFMLVAEPKNQLRYKDSVTTARHGVGAFQLYGDALTMFSGSCPHAIMHTTFVPKEEIQVMWQAPRSGSGCVVFRATVVETRGVWYKDDGGLTRELCEQEEESPDQQGEVLEKCCACDEAKYELTFEGIWSRHTHPKDFPRGHRTHFSDIIGASHTPNYRIWEYDGYASEGVHEVAEMGETKILESELKAQSNKIRTIIKARGLFFPNVTEKTFAVFRVDIQHHVMSLLSMLGPSPDWIVGVSALELCLRNCSWLTEKVLNLYPWDAGTDDGISYISPRSPTNPPDKIRKITSTMPDNPESPFYDPTGLPMKPVARLIVTRQRIYEKPCENPDTPDRYPYPERDPCALTEWTEFTPCSVTCGRGVQTRHRKFLDEMKALHGGCRAKTVDEQSCEVICVGNISCMTSMWGEWTECNVLCGKGYRERKRTYMNSKARNVCHSNLKDREDCMAYSSDCVTSAPEWCAVTEWSLWMPCVDNCAKGKMFRTRNFRQPSAADHCRVERTQLAPCNDRFPDCRTPNHNNQHPVHEICSLPKEVGPCRGYHPRWYYDESSGTCQKFTWSGCLGNNNNFHNIQDCRELCEQAEVSSYYLSTPPTPVESTEDSDEDRVVDCVLTPWTEWTPCTNSCNTGRRDRRRQIEVHPQNGGKPCPTKMVQRRKCKNNPACPVDCAMTHWSAWTQCSESCGAGAVQIRTRDVKRPPSLGGRVCATSKEERYCNLPPCE